MADGSSVSDSLELNPDGTSMQKRNQHRSSRGRARQDHNHNLSGHNNYDSPPQYSQFQQCSNSPYVHYSSPFPGSAYAPFQREDRDTPKSRGRGGGGGGGGRGRVGNGGSNGGGGRGPGPGPGRQPQRWQRPGKDVSQSGGYHGDIGGGGQRPKTPPVEKRDIEGSSWRREPGWSDMRAPQEDHQVTRPKKPRRFTQEPRRREVGERNQKAAHPHYKQENQENQAGGGGRWETGSREECRQSETGNWHQRNLRAEEGGNSRTDPRKKLPEPKRRQGPIKEQARVEREPERGASARDASPNRNPARDEEGPGAEEESGWRGGRGQGRRTPLQDRGQRRPPHQEHRFGRGQTKRDELPKSKETQTGCLIEQLSEEKYECMVCCEIIRHMAPVWSCQSCYHVFHLNCIKKWARSPASQADDTTEGWRCPACQNVVFKPPNSYTCFCGKVTNPEWQRTEIPHSCGDICGKKRSGADCNHPCNILCHPGPCPQCPAFIHKSCICGRTSQPMRCGQATAIQCDTVCGAVLNCGEHACSQACHSGACQACPLQVQQACYCGVVSREVLCGTDKESFDGSGHFSCQKPCGKMLECRSHRCQQVCHAGPCQPCPRSPRLVKSCPCGQTALAKLLELGYSERHSCSDPIASCGRTCNKPLPCGSNDSIHVCEKLCHEGSCGPCGLTSTVRCRCGSKTKEVPCATIHNEDQLVFSCEKRCSKKRSCGRHKCNELCCVAFEHKCSLICGHMLTCGLHRCQELCHRGNCQPCWQTSFDELACYCGASVLFPPIACGTKPPECKNPCTRKHECDHQVFHNCHSEEKCPPCTYLTTKWCMGKHEQRSNIPCHLQDISCGLVCKKVLPCELHQCRRICHRGNCLAECRQPCVVPRPDCGHPCSSPCHKGSSCPRNTCTAKVALQCECGRRKELVACTEAASSYQRYAAIAMASKLSDMQLGDSVDIGQFITKKEQKQNRLECDQECAALERNRRLAEALQIDESVDPFNIRSTSKYSDSLKDDARKDLKFVREVEEEIKNLVELASKGKQPKRSHCFPPMNREHRKMVHELAEAYGVESVSYDSEPKRNVVVTATRGKSACPNSTLASLIERETATRAPPPIAHIKQHSSKSDSGGSSWSKMVKEEPVIDYFDVQD